MSDTEGRPTGEAVSERCPFDGDPLSDHIGGKPCVGGYESPEDRRARRVHEQERKRVVRLFGEDAV